MITKTIQFAMDNVDASDRVLSNYCYDKQFSSPDFSWDKHDYAERIEHILCYPYVFGGVIQWGKERTQAAEELAIHYPACSDQYDDGDDEYEGMFISDTIRGFIAECHDYATRCNSFIA